MSLRAAAASARAFARTAAVSAETPVMLTCAVSGGIVTGNPRQPVTRDEVISEAIGAAKAGASIVHVHARTTAGEMSQSADDYLAIKQAIREEAEDIVLNFSTGGGALDASAAERRLPLMGQPELATLSCGSMNFGPSDDLLLNPRSLIAELADEMAQRKIVPEYECFDLGMAVTAAKLATSARGASGMMHMVLGVMGGAPASVATILLFAQLVPDGVPWTATAIGRHFPMMAVALALGGHIRTGLEDVLYLAPGEYAASNAQLVARATMMCESVGRPVATPAQAREILGIDAARGT
ncbi:MAG TPA: 3-keto-5-aminohexanoate cleavage protein [Solirubrobacteraceae bacterium]